jgi:enoyl-CoA hydratase/carnithine racemase
VSGAKVTGEVRDGVAELVFDNPARMNAINLAMSQQASDLIDALAQDERVRLLVVRGAGATFVSGADISEFEALRSQPEAIARYEAISTGLYMRVRNFPKPTLARINGFCFGAGMGLAAACDLRFATQDAVFSVPAARLGIAYRPDFISWLIQIVGAARLKEILITGRRYSAQEALAMGLVHQTAPVKSFDRDVEAYIATIAQNAPLSTLASKKMVDEYADPTRPPDEALCKALSQACLASADYVEGRRAFMEKRRPDFQGS